MDKEATQLQISVKSSSSLVRDNVLVTLLPSFGTGIEVGHASVLGGVQQNQAQPISDSSDFQSAKLCQQMLMEGANQMGVSAASQMAAAQNLATSATDPHSQQVHW